VGRRVEADAATGTITNNKTWNGDVVSNSGTIANAKTWNGTVSNAGTFDNDAGRRSRAL
jgi:hypothetical protein